MTCRHEVLECAREIVDESGVNEFTPKEIVSRMKSKGTAFKESTIRTHVVSRMCANAPQHHAVKYEDFERIGHGVYKML